MPGWCHHIDRPELWRKWTIPAGASCKCVSSLMLADDDDTKCTQVFEYTCPRDATLPAGGGGDANMSPLEDADILQDSASVQMDEAADMSPIRDDDKLPDSAEKVANEEGKKSGRCDSYRLRKKRCDGSHEDCAKNTQLGSDRNGRVQAFEYACPQREAPPSSPSSVPMDASEDADACVSPIEGVGRLMLRRRPSTGRLEADATPAGCARKDVMAAMRPVPRTRSQARAETARRLLYHGV